MRLVSEAARTREILRYKAQVIATTRLYTPSEIAASPPNTDFDANPVFTSLAQLAAVRFDATGAILSLFDAQNQYFIAQATQTSPIIRTEHDDDGEQCCLVGKAIPRPNSFFEDVLLESGLENGPLPVSVVPDIASSHNSSRLVGIPGLTDARFYSAVPIRSPRDINIGVFAVYGSQPITKIEPRLIRFLRDISTAITSNLGSAISRINLTRSERMVRGLGSFVEGAAGLSFNSTTFNLDSFHNEGLEETLITTQQDIMRSDRERGAQVPFLSELEPRSRQDTGDRSPSPFPRTVIPTRRKSHEVSGSHYTHEEGLPVPSIVPTSLTREIESSGSIDGDENEHMSSIKCIFARAANIIRESIEVEGVVFVDASVSSFGSLIGTDNNSDASLSAHTSSDESLVDDSADKLDNICDVLGYSTTTSSSLDTRASVPDETKIPEGFFKTLLRRYPEGKIYHFTDTGSVSTGTSDLSENEPATASPPSSTTNSTGGISKPAGDKPRERQSIKKWSKQAEGVSLLRIIPDASGVIIVPLWDYNKQVIYPTYHELCFCRKPRALVRWYAGGIVWTRTPARLFSRQADLSYLRAFGMSILSELSRLDVQIHNKAKSDVLSSLSHELRSPLHGVIAAAELLHDTSLDAFQCDVLHSLESSGRVLLDVLNHLLDYSKVNTVMRKPKSMKKTRRSKISASQNQSRFYNQLQLDRYMYIDSLFEESIDSVFAGHIFQKLSIAQVDHRLDRNADALALQQTDVIDAVESFGHQTGSFGQLNIKSGEVSVLVDIDPSVPWGFHIQPGAFRRIILNILGNSLRYTHRGSVVITLGQERKSRKLFHHTNIRLTVTDTGRGIGSYFMQHHLFKPFSQEDHLSPGTGLGLSLVKQIVENLHGSVSIQSQVGVGTRVQVTIPVPEGMDETRRESNFTNHRKALAGRRVSLFGLSKTVWKGIKDEPLVSEFDLMHRVCSDWLRMEVVECDNDQLHPDLILCGEPSMSKLLRDKKSSLSVPIVVICKDATVAHKYSKFGNDETGHGILEFISQPIGPRKLAKSLDVVLRRWTEATQVGLTNAPSNIATRRLQPSTMHELAEHIPEVFTVPNSVALRNEVSIPKPAVGREFPNDELRTEEVTPLEKDQQKVDPPISSIDKPEHGISKSSEGSRKDGQTASSTGADRSGMILLVDDNNINLRILVAYMKKLKRPYKTATNGLEAFEVFATDPSNFSCVLMDLSMPVMDGLESTRKIREFERSLNQQSAVTIIALTGRASLQSQREAYASGIDIYFTKPVGLQALANFLADKHI